MVNITNHNNLSLKPIRHEIDPLLGGGPDIDGQVPTGDFPPSGAAATAAALVDGWAIRSQKMLEEMVLSQALWWLVITTNNG